jgi:hypothetical protein
VRPRTATTTSADSWLPFSVFGFNSATGMVLILLNLLF